MNENSSEHGKQFIIPIILTAITVLLGIISFNAVFPEYPFLRKLYYTFQLFTLESGDRFYEKGIQPFWISAIFNMARFLAVATLITTIVLAILSVIRYKYYLSKVRFMKGHTILCGLGGIGAAFADNFENKEKLVIIEKDTSNENLSRLKKAGAKIVVANALDITILKKLGAEHAESVVALTGNDFDNFKIINNLIKLTSENGSVENQLSLSANIDSRNLKAAITNEWLNNPGSNICILGTILKDYVDKAKEMVKNKRNGVEIPELQKRYLDARQSLTEYNPDSETYSDSMSNVRLLNINQLAGRFISRYYPPDRFRQITGEQDDAMKIIFIGFSNIGEEIMKNCFLNCHYLNRKRTRISLIAVDGDIIRDSLESKYKNISRLIDLNIIKYNPHHMTFRFVVDNKLENPDIIYITSGEDRYQVSYSLRARELFGEKTSIIRPFYNDNFLCDSNQIKDTYSINIFGKIANKEHIINASLDRKAKSIHNNWLQKAILDYISDTDTRVAKGMEIREPKRTILPWHLVDEEIREDNRSVVDHACVKLRSAGELTDPDQYGNPENAGINFSFLSDSKLVDRLASMEHRRWMANKFISGWVTGDPRNDNIKRHNCLIDYEFLDKDTQDYDRRQILSLKEIIKY